MWIANRQSFLYRTFARQALANEALASRTLQNVEAQQVKHIYFILRAALRVLVQY